MGTDAKNEHREFDMLYRRDIPGFIPPFLVFGQEAGRVKKLVDPVKFFDKKPD